MEADNVALVQPNISHAGGGSVGIDEVWGDY